MDFLLFTALCMTGLLAVFQYLLNRPLARLLRKRSREADYWELQYRLLHGKLQAIRPALRFAVGHPQDPDVHKALNHAIDLVEGCTPTPPAGPPDAA